MKKLWVLVTIIIILLPMTASIPNVSCDPNLVPSADYPSIVAPSSSFRMNVTITNQPDHNDWAANPKTTVTTYYPDYITIESPITVDLTGMEIPPDGKKHSVGLFTIHVAPNTPEGSYSVFVEIHYNWNPLFVAGRNIWRSSGEWGIGFHFTVVTRNIVYDGWTNFPQSVSIRNIPLQGANISLYTLPEKKLVYETLSLQDGSYSLKPQSYNASKKYLLIASMEEDGRMIKQEKEITGLAGGEIYLPKGLVQNYVKLVEGLDDIKLPLLSDVDLALGLGFGGPFKETSLYGPLAQLSKILGIEISDAKGLRADLNAYLDKILDDSPPCYNLVLAPMPSDPWSNLLRLTLVIGFVKNRVPDAYYSIDNVVKGLTVGLMTSLFLDNIKSAGKGWQAGVDKYTPKLVRDGQSWLIDNANKNVMKVANTIHVTIFAGAFGLRGVDYLLEKAGIKKAEDKAIWKTVLAKVIRFGITDFIRKNMGTSLVFELIFQSARTIGDASLLQLYLYLSRNQIAEALQLAKDGRAAQPNLQVMNEVGILDTEHDGWHKIQHTWAISWFQAANVFRGAGGFWAFWNSVPGGTAVAQPLIKKVMTLAPWLKAAGIGSFAGVVITETRALIVTYMKQGKVVNASYGKGYELVFWTPTKNPVEEFITIFIIVAPVASNESPQFKPGKSGWCLRA